MGQATSSAARGRRESEVGNAAEARNLHRSRSSLMSLPSTAVTSIRDCFTRVREYLSPGYLVQVLKFYSFEAS